MVWSNILACRCAIIERRTHKLKQKYTRTIRSSFSRARSETFIKRLKGVRSSLTFVNVLQKIEGKGLVKAKGVAEAALGVSFTFPHKSGNLFCSVGRQKWGRGIGEGKREKK